MKKMKKTTNDRCVHCASPALKGEDLCPPCSIELAYRILAEEPHPEHRTCTICGAPYGFTEARVIRSVKNPRAGNQATPWMCWVCAHLHLAAQLPTHDGPLYL